MRDSRESGYGVETAESGGRTVRGYRWVLTAVGFAGVLTLGSASFSSCSFDSSAPPPPPPRYYLAMGASLTTGSGVPAGQGYVDLVRAHESARLTNLVAVRLGCFGETTNSMMRGGDCVYSHGSQLAEAEAFLSAHPGQVAFITMEIGADDITPCFSASGVDQACAQTAIDDAATNLTIILRRLRTAGGAVPIFGMTYYDPFLAYWVSGFQNAATQSEQAAVTGNAAITDVYQAAGAQVADVQTAFDTTNFAMTGSYNGTTVPQNVANICAWTLNCSAGDVHANEVGYSVIADAFEPLIDATVSP